MPECLPLYDRNLDSEYDRASASYHLGPNTLERVKQNLVEGLAVQEQGGEGCATINQFGYFVVKIVS